MNNIANTLRGPMPTGADLTAAADYIEELEGYREAYEDSKRLARLIDIAMHGEDGAAKQASLCDLVGPANDMRVRIAELEERVEELQAACEVVSSEFEGDLWVSVRRLLTETGFDFSNRPDGVSAELAYEHLRDAQLALPVCVEVNPLEWEESVNDFNGTPLHRASAPWGTYVVQNVGLGDGWTIEHRGRFINKVGYGSLSEAKAATQAPQLGGLLMGAGLYRTSKILITPSD